MFCVRNGSSPGPMRHHVRESAESPEWPTAASSTTTSSLRTRGASSCASRNSFSPYCSELIPRRKTRLFLPMFGLLFVRTTHNVLPYDRSVRIHARQHRPHSAEIVEQVKGAIRQGRLAPGDQLPAERVLTKQ